MIVSTGVRIPQAHSIAVECRLLRSRPIANRLQPHDVAVLLFQVFISQPHNRKFRRFSAVTVTNGVLKEDSHV